MKRRRIEWLLKRLAATAALIYGLNVIAFVVATIAVWASLGWAEDALAPAWIDWWGLVGMVIPLAAIAPVGVAWVVVKLVRYWRAS